MTTRTVKVGTRGSALALKQTELVLSALQALDTGHDFEVVTVRTQGDANTTAPLAGMGLGVFVKEIEQQLLSGQIDLAVHSLKDLPTLLPDGLALGAYLDREDPRDVLVNRWECPLSQMPAEARIGTSSPRRVAQLRDANPSFQILPIRGNVETRLAKARSDEFDGVILAAAGMIRLGLADQISEYLPAEQFVPPPGQGVMAVEMRADDAEMAQLLGKIDHAVTRACVQAERYFLELLGGGCQLPVGAYAQAQSESLELTFFMSTPGGESVFREKVTGSMEKPRELAEQAHRLLMSNAPVELVEVIGGGGN